MDRIGQVKDRDQLRAFINAVMNLRIYGMLESS
jgi:hypothetical protein